MKIPRFSSFKCASDTYLGGNILQQRRRSLRASPPIWNRGGALEAAGAAFGFAGGIVGSSIREAVRAEKRQRSGAFMAGAAMVAGRAWRPQRPPEAVASSSSGADRRAAPPIWNSGSAQRPREATASGRPSGGKTGSGAGLSRRYQKRPYLI